MIQHQTQDLNNSINYKLMNINLKLTYKNMELLNPTTHKIMTSILRNVAEAPTLASLGESLSMSHVGIWKAAKKLESENLIILKKTGKKGNSTYTLYLNWKNDLVGKTLELALAHEASLQRRWIFDFAELEKEVDFLILYGSILHSSKEANDIDILGVVSRKGSFSRIGEIILKIQVSQEKKIHLINFSPDELKVELKRPNQAFLDAFKKGIVLFGQDKFVNFVKEMKQ